MSPSHDGRDPRVCGAQESEHSGLVRGVQIEEPRQSICVILGLLSDGERSVGVLREALVRRRRGYPGGWPLKNSSRG
jgi:hypothetical protein